MHIKIRYGYGLMAMVTFDVNDKTDRVGGVGAVGGGVEQGGECPRR